MSKTDNNTYTDEKQSKHPTPLLDPIPEGIPKVLKNAPRWAPWEGVWDPKRKGGRGAWDKVPRDPQNLMHGLSSHAKWYGFAMALEGWDGLSLVAPGGGVGFNMTRLRGLVAGDLDDCFNADGSLAPWAAEIIQKAATYAELSPSGKGARFFLRAQLAEDWTQVKPEKKAAGVGGIEMYGGNSPRFVTVTGRKLEGCPDDVAEAPAGFLDWLAAEYRKVGGKEKSAQEPPPDMPDLIDVGDLPRIADLSLSPRVVAFLETGECGADGSRALAGAAIALLEATATPSGMLRPAVVLSMLADNSHAWAIAMRHRKDDEARALEYLWRWHVSEGLSKARPVAGEFENLDETEGGEASGGGDQQQGDGSEAKKPRRGLVRMDQFIAELPTPDFIVDDIMQRGWLYSLTAPTGHGKTAVALEMAFRVATGTPLGDAGCDQGSVVYLAGENADDVRARCLMAAEREMDRFNDPNDLPIYFLDRVIRVEESIDWLFKEIEKVGGASLVVVDTAAAYFTGDDDNNNVEMGDYARMLRRLCGAKGRPTVVVLSHPIKSPSKGNLLPRGGGAFLNEVDGNLRLWSDQRGVTELHWCGKFRGKEFEAVTFKLEEAKSGKYVDSKGRRMSSVIASVMPPVEVETAQARHLDLTRRVLQSFVTHPGASFEERCRLLGMVSDKGTTQKSSLKKIIDRHVEAKFLAKEEFGTAYRITKRGRAVLSKGGDSTSDDGQDDDLSTSNEA